MSYAEFGGRILSDLPATDFTIRDRARFRGAQIEQGESRELSSAEKGALQIRYKRTYAALLKAGASSKIDIGNGLALSKSAVFEMVQGQADQLKQAGLGERAERIRGRVKLGVG